MLQPSTPAADAERIDNELQRQVARCSCSAQYRVKRVGEGKYQVSGEDCDTMTLSSEHWCECMNA